MEFCGLEACCVKTNAETEKNAWRKVKLFYKKLDFKQKGMKNRNKQKKKETKNNNIKGKAKTQKHRTKKDTLY